MLAVDGFEAPDPRNQFITDLTLSIKEWQSSGDEVLLSMDINKQLGDSAKGLTYLMRECQLIDMFHHHHGVYPSFETFDLGRKRLNYIIGSSSLLPLLMKCGYLAFYHGIPSDHRGLFIDFSLEMVDGITRLENTPIRYLHSTFQKDVYKYKQFVHKEFASLEKSELFELRSKVEEAEQEGRDLLVEMARQVKDQIADAQNRLDEAE